MKKIFALSLALFGLLSLQAQQAKLKGQIGSDADNENLSGITILLLESNQKVSADATGKFEITNINYGSYTMQIQGEGFEMITKVIKVDQPEMVLSLITLQADDYKAQIDNGTTVVVADDGGSGSSQMVASVLNASRDVFVAATSFNFSAARFRLRGYDAENFVTLMNGSPTTDLVTGRTMFFLWSGLNDVMRSRETSLGLAQSTYTFGGVGGSFSIDSRASHQRKQLQASYAISNRTYDNRFMLTYGSGWLKGNWSIAASISRRWAQEGFIKGTFFDGTSYFLAIDKKINAKHMLSLTTFGTPNSSGRAAPATLEQIELAGDKYYNSFWGYQNGKMRNSSVAKSFDPTAILTHEWNINNRTQVISAATITVGRNSRSAFDWFNAPDPRPEYYKNLPSYYNDPQAANAVATYLKDNPNMMQVQWDQLYEANRLNVETFENVDGVAGKNITGAYARYVLEERRIDHTIFNFNTYINTMISDNISVNGGLTYQFQKSNYYKVIGDLMGADYYVDINRFASLDSTDYSLPLFQSDLNNPNRILKEGDRFGYDYDAVVGKGTGWASATARFAKIDLFASAELSNTGFYRNGNMRNGNFADESYGKSAKQSFTNYALKGGATYKINGRNYVFANAMTLTRAPLFDNVYAAPRVRNQIASNLINENIMGLEAGYFLRAPKLRGRAVAYYTTFENQYNTFSAFTFEENAFVNFTNTAINKTHKGIELALESLLPHGITLSGAASIGQFVYTDRPKLTITQDNTAEQLVKDETVYIKNFHVATGPQSAYTAGISYRSKNFWFVSLNANYFAQIYADVYQYRRTTSATDLVEPGSQLWNDILKQTQYDGQYTIDFFGGWSYRLNNNIKSLKRPMYIVINVGVNNLLNNTDLVTGAFEPLRFDKSLTTFAENAQPRLYYGFGRTYFINLVFRMN
ncbi:MAG: TonB-dependent receptor [Bacteroidetes bacterium]|nr:TonB-dependent receptor [Bacteroidota bacterium]